MQSYAERHFQAPLLPFDLLVTQPQISAFLSISFFLCLLKSKKVVWGTVQTDWKSVSICHEANCWIIQKEMEIIGLSCEFCILCSSKQSSMHMLFSKGALTHAQGLLFFLLPFLLPSLARFLLSLPEQGREIVFDSNNTRIVFGSYSVLSKHWVN